MRDARDRTQRTGRAPTWVIIGADPCILINDFELLPQLALYPRDLGYQVFHLPPGGVTFLAATLTLRGLLLLRPRRRRATCTICRHPRIKKPERSASLQKKKSERSKNDELPFHNTPCKKSGKIDTR
jgi:hypothetical protein